MSKSSDPRIVFSERLSMGIVVHFETGEPVFFPAAFLYEQRAAQPNAFVRDDEEGDDAAYWMVGESHAPSSNESTPEQKDQKSNQPKILVVDDNERARTSLGEALAINQFQVTTAASVGEALHLIQAEPFDVLLSAVRMTGADGKFGLLKAMHSKNPNAVTMAYTGYSELEQALNAIRLPANEATVKPMAITTLVALIHEKVEKLGTLKATNRERVAAILERNSSATISDWLARVEREDELTRVPLSKEERTGHLPKLIEELVHRLRVPRRLGAKAVSEAAVRHGQIRREQGYSVPMIIEESRILQVSIFQTLQNNLSNVDFNSLLIDVMAIADEVDSQLKQTIISFTAKAAAA